VTYDRERQIAEPTEQFEELEPTLFAVLEADPALEVSLKLAC
jgi:hypothetical protein